jgi:hypothetical protein
MRQSDGGPSLVRWQTERGGEKLEVGLDAVEGGGAHSAFYRPGRGGVKWGLQWLQWTTVSKH